MKEHPSQAEYRRRILCPTTISYYKRQDFRPGIPKMDGAYVAEYLLKNSIKEPFSTKLLVEKEGIDPSEFIDEDALTYDSMLEHMNTGYGIIFWQGHGNDAYSVRTIWNNDKNKNENGIAETSNHELYSSTFVGTSLMNKVTAKSPFVFQGSCLNGSEICVIVAENEGKSCSTGKFCVKNEVCTNGFCEDEAPDMPAAKECSKTECSESNGFFEVADPSQNWNDCTTSDGKEGYCDYGSCTPKKEQKKESSSSSGCSLTVF